MALAKKLAKAELYSTIRLNLQREIQAFNEPTGRTTGMGKPQINQYYADTFNAVDRFNRIFSQISYKPRESNTDFCILQSLVRICAIQTWALLSDYKINNNIDNCEQHICEFFIDLSKNLSNMK